LLHSENTFSFPKQPVNLMNWLLFYYYLGKAVAIVAYTTAEDFL